MTGIAPRRGPRGGMPRPMQAALVGAICALLAAPAGAAGDLQQVRLRHKIVVAVFPTQDNTIAVNLEMLQGQHFKVEELRRPEQFRGCQVDLFRGFASSLGMSLEFLPITTGPAELFSALTEGKADLVGGNVGVTPKRRETADFSHPIASARIAVVTRPGISIATREDLAGKTAAVLDRSTAYELVRAEAPQAKLKLDQFQAEVFSDVEDGTADFTLVATELGPGSEYSLGSAKLRVGLVLYEATTAIAARKGSDLIPVLDAYLDKLKQSGDLDRILARCGGLPPPAQPAPPHP
jgi:ABC-type amino acid transport substrate-binding protein